jgi:hypothetical protein
MTGSINFCGGCNPKIDRVALAEEIKLGLIARGIKVVYNTIDADFIVYISGCPVDCVTRAVVDSGKIAVTIAGATVNAQVVSEDCLATIAIQKIEDFIAKKETPAIE